MRYFKRSKLELDALVKPLSLKDLTSESEPAQKVVSGKTKNISASGAMIELAEEIGENSYIMIHIYLDKEDFPKAIPAQTVWSKSHDDINQTGIRFLTRQEIKKLIGEQNIPRQPDEELGFTENQQEALDKLLDDILELPDDEEY